MNHYPFQQNQLPKEYEFKSLYEAYPCVFELVVTLNGKDFVFYKEYEHEYLKRISGYSFADIVMEEIVEENLTELKSMLIKDHSHLIDPYDNGIPHGFSFISFIEIEPRKFELVLDFEGQYYSHTKEVTEEQVTGLYLECNRLKYIVNMICISMIEEWFPTLEDIMYNPEPLIEDNKGGFH